MINCALTVVKKTPGSHMKIWEKYTNQIIKIIAETCKRKLIFVLWGNFAKKKKSLIGSDHHILEFKHPSPMANIRGEHFETCRHFGQINKILKQRKEKLIDWTLDD